MLTIETTKRVASEGLFLLRERKDGCPMGVTPQPFVGRALKAPEPRPGSTQ